MKYELEIILSSPEDYHIFMKGVRKHDKKHGWPVTELQVQNDQTDPKHQAIIITIYAYGARTLKRYAKILEKTEAKASLRDYGI